MLRARQQQSSDALRDQLAALVRERQALRDTRVSLSVLEENRLAIVHAQLELSRALVSEHLDSTKKSPVAA
jgi:hypothetical protein